MGQGVLRENIKAGIFTYILCIYIMYTLRMYIYIYTYIYTYIYIFKKKKHFKYFAILPLSVYLSKNHIYNLTFTILYFRKLITKQVPAF